MLAKFEAEIWLVYCLRSERDRYLVFEEVADQGAALVVLSVLQSSIHLALRQ